MRQLTQADCVQRLKKVRGITVRGNKVTIEKGIIGNKMLGRLDFLKNYCNFTIVDKRGVDIRNYNGPQYIPSQRAAEVGPGNGKESRKVRRMKRRLRDRSNPRSTMHTSFSGPGSVVESRGRHQMRCPGSQQHHC